MREVDVVILGAGGAGMMCAAEAAKRGRNTVLIDHASVLGRKILISGGGRCNFTNIYTDSESYVSSNPHFAKSALAKFTPYHFIDLVEKHKIPYHEKKLGQLFCDESAKQIVDLLETECLQNGVQFELNSIVELVGKIENKAFVRRPYLKDSSLSTKIEDVVDGQELPSISRYLIKTHKEVFLSESLVIATGGLSVPKVGASGIGYKIAKSFGLRIVETKPALDGFVFSPHDKEKYQEMYGTACDVNFSVNNMCFRENILFTHLGLSGPASLQGSLYWDSGDEISLDLCPEINLLEQIKELREKGTKKAVKAILKDWLPNRLAERIVGLVSLEGKVAELSNKQIDYLDNFIKHHRIKPVDTVGYVKAEVTKGGVDTSNLSSKSMEAKVQKGLFFIGEVVDVTGQLGGYNFQWAWASGHAAGQSA